MKSLRSRLTLTHALVAFVAVAIVAVLVTAVIRYAFDQLTDRRIQVEASAAAEVIGAVYQRRQSWDGVQVALQRRLTQSGPNDPIKRRRMQVFDDQGGLVFDSARPVIQRLQRKPLNGVESPIVVDGRTVGTVVMGGQIGEFTKAESDFLRLVRLSVVIGSVLAGGVALIVGLVITGRVTRPLRSLKDAAQRLAAGARHEPLAVPPDKELAELAVSFNSMAAELERQQQLRRQLVADIAHELRTPLSVLRLQLEGLEDGVEQPTPATLRSLSEEVGLLARLVDDLRLLSLADAGQISLAIDDLDATTAIQRAVAASMARARQQGIDLRAEPPLTLLTASADPQRLAQILGNLIENALRYTPAGGTVTVRAHADTRPPNSKDETRDLRLVTSEALQASSLKSQVPSGAVVVFEVADTGAGIPPDQLPRIFERFYRADKARARETGGSGLGLAIVQRLVEMQGGRIWATSTIGRGSTFHVALPAVVPAEAARTPLTAPARR
jgi:signal transduction histidine kinase